MIANGSPGHDLAGVQVYYILPTSRFNRRYVAPDRQLNMSEYAPYDVPVRDARPAGSAISLASHGFTLLPHVTHTDFGDRAQIDRAYLPEMERLLREVTGAERVIAFAWMQRTAAPDGGEAHPPANDVHVDYTPAFAECMARRALAWNGEPAERFRRFSIINIWRSFSGAPQDWPLGLCDATSIAGDEDVTYNILSVDRLPEPDEIPEVLPGDPLRPTVPEISAFQFRPQHRWYYYADMRPDEVLLFTNYDSTRTGAWRVPHAGFRDPTCTATWPRQSIEVRLLAFFL
ncbi:MAG: CmcJ/NvfI family oxidoreductase [Candidatus Binatia bacterium]